MFYFQIILLLGIYIFSGVKIVDTSIFKLIEMWSSVIRMTTVNMMIEIKSWLTIQYIHLVQDLQIAEKVQSLTRKMFGDSVPGSVPLLVLRRGLADDAGREAAAEDPVLALVPLDPVLLPSTRPEQSYIARRIIFYIYLSKIRNNLEVFFDSLDTIRKNWEIVIR